MTWVKVRRSGAAPAARCGHSMAYDPKSHSMIVFGGGGPSSAKLPGAEVGTAVWALGRVPRRSRSRSRGHSRVGLRTASRRSSEFFVQMTTPGGWTWRQAKLWKTSIRGNHDLIGHPASCATEHAHECRSSLTCLSCIRPAFSAWMLESLCLNAAIENQI